MTSSTVSAPNRKKFDKKKAAQPQAATAAAAAAPTIVAPAEPASESSSPAAIPTPAEPGQHQDHGDFLVSTMQRLKSARPEVLRTSSYYEGAKSLYGLLAGLPVLSACSPAVEAVVLAAANMVVTPTEENNMDMHALDKRIGGALCSADTMVDTTKDAAIDGILSVRMAIAKAGIVQSAAARTDAVKCAAVSAAESTKHTMSGIIGSARATVKNAVGGCVDGVKVRTDAVKCAAVYAAESAKKSKAAGMIDSARATVKNAVGGCVDGVKGIFADVAESVGSVWNWATSFVGDTIAWQSEVLGYFRGSKTKAGHSLGGIIL